MYYYLFMYAGRQTCLQAFRHSGIQVGMFSYNHVGRCVYMQTGILACKPASRQAVTQSSLQEYAQVRRCASSPTLPRRNKKIFPKENRKRKKRKRKQSKRTGCRQAKRNRNKSRRVSCEERARHYAEVFLPDCESPSYLRFLFIISVDKNINNNR
jgi:hypothetical protein